MEIKLPIAKPPWSRLGQKMESACRKALYDFSMVDKTDDIAVALSGGKDSLSLLYLLSAISGRGFPKFNLHAIHIEGEFSCGSSLSKNFLKAICKDLQINFITKSISQKQDSINCYICSRKRRKLLFTAAKQLNCSTIAFGHHSDDTIQTLLLNLFHKGEFATMLPKLTMYDFNITIIRPLIYIREKEIIQFAKNYGFQRTYCQCPLGQNSKRIEVEKLLRRIEEIFPNTRSNLAHAAFNYGSNKASNFP